MYLGHQINWNSYTLATHSIQRLHYNNAPSQRHRCFIRIEVSLRHGRKPKQSCYLMCRYEVELRLYESTSVTPLSSYLLKNSSNVSRCENPFCLILMVSSTPVYLSCFRIFAESKCFGDRESLGLRHLTNCGVPLTIFCRSSISENLKYVETVCWARDWDAKPLLLNRSCRWNMKLDKYFTT